MSKKAEYFDSERVEKMKKAPTKRKEKSKSESGSDSDSKPASKLAVKSSPGPAPAAAAAAASTEGGATITVVIKLPSGEAFPMNLPTSETVFGVKRRLASDQGVTPERLTLAVGGKPLDTPGATLSACGVTNEAMIKVQTFFFSL